MPGVISALRKENSEIRSQVSARDAIIERMRLEHEATIVRLTAELVALKQRMFGPKAEKVKNAASQQALFDTSRSSVFCRRAIRTRGIAQARSSRT